MGNGRALKDLKLKPELYEYLRYRANQHFDIKSNNCIQFTNKCWEIYHGKPWCEDLNKYSSITETNWNDPIEAADTILQRSYEGKEGYLVGIKAGNGHYYLKGYACGFCLGDLTVFLNDKGLRYLPTKKLKLFWRTKDDI